MQWEHVPPALRPERVEVERNAFEHFWAHEKQVFLNVPTALKNHFKFEENTLYV